METQRSLSINRKTDESERESVCVRVCNHTAQNNRAKTAIILLEVCHRPSVEEKLLKGRSLTVCACVTVVSSCGCGLDEGVTHTFRALQSGLVSGGGGAISTVPANHSHYLQPLDRWLLVNFTSLSGPHSSCWAGSDLVQE